MTEEEARKKWCPHARDSNTAGNRMQYGGLDGDPQYGTETAATFPCIASACMAWRWQPAQETQSKLVAIRDYRDRHDTDLATAKNAVEAAWTTPAATDGFCGLAGRPQ